MIGQALVILQFVVAPLPAAAPFDEEEVPEVVLAEQRGGIRLPNGIDVRLSIDTVTALDGSIVLQTVTKIAEGAPVITVYVPEDGVQVPLAQREGGGASAGRAQPRVSYDRQHGLTVTAGMPAMPVTLTRGDADTAGEPAARLQAIDLAQSATTANGVVQARGERGMGGVELQGMDIRIVHLTGSAYGSVIANSGSDRAIDTQTTLSIDLRNAGPDVLGSTMLRVEDVANRAMGTRF